MKQLLLKVIAWMLICVTVLSTSSAMTYASDKTSAQSLRDRYLQYRFGPRKESVWERYSVWFGRCEQDNDDTNGLEPIEWQILDQIGDYFLLVSKDCLALLPYTTDPVDLSWNNSVIRKYLNEDLFFSAFTAAEREAVKVNLTTDGEFLCADRMFIFSRQEMEMLGLKTLIFSPEPSESVMAEINGRNSTAQEPWLRKSNRTSDKDVLVQGGNAYYYPSTGASCGVRPAMWVRTDAVSYSSPEPEEGVINVSSQQISLSGDPTQIYTATDHVFLSGERVNIYLEPGSKVVCSVLEDYDFLVGLLEDTLGLQYEGPASEYRDHNSRLTPLENRNRVFGGAYFPGVDDHSTKFSIVAAAFNNPLVDDQVITDGNNLIIGSKYTDLYDEYNLYLSARHIAEELIRDHMYQPPEGCGQFFYGLRDYASYTARKRQDRFALDYIFNDYDTYVPENIELTSRNAEKLCTTCFNSEYGNSSDEEYIHYLMVKYMLEECADVDIQLLIDRLNGNDDSFRTWPQGWLAEWIKLRYGYDFFERFAGWYSDNYEPEA